MENFTPPSLEQCDAAWKKHAASFLKNSQIDLVVHAKFLEEVITSLFPIQNDIELFRKCAHDAALIAYAKRHFVQRRALKLYTKEDVATFDLDFLDDLGVVEDLSFAQKISLLGEDDPVFCALLKYAAWAVLTPEGKKLHRKSTLFVFPSFQDFHSLIDLATLPPTTHKRDGFSLTDHGASQKQSLSQSHYCIICHPQKKDSCAHGMKEREGHVKKNPLGIALAGCPLGQKISEMNQLRQEGFVIGALAVAMIDNPLLMLTGHRICNACSKACIFQKQEAVNIPGIESEIIRTILMLPFGFEIYALLSRWNPLNLGRPHTKKPTGRKILVVGSGPAGMNLAYHLLEDGHEVTMVEGAKIEPLPPHFAAVTKGETVRHCAELFEDLDKRIPQGFGGVAEYGITVRWDKNYLTLVRLLLERRLGFTLLGGVRFGGTVTTAQAFDELGFDHIALCCGAGKPKFLEIPGNDAKGVRYASDFLMTLQQGGAFLGDGIASLDLMLPAVVIGGGLTSLDTATEILAYYPRYVQKISEKAARSKTFSATFSAFEQERLQTILYHHSLFEKERNQAKKEGRGLNFTPIFETIGGVTVMYRGDLTHSPAYRLNHEEIRHALREGVQILTHTHPLSITKNEEAYVTHLECANNYHEKVNVPASSILIATGMHPHTTIMEEEGFASDLKALTPGDFFIHTHTRQNTEAFSKKVSVFGDMHPHYHGSVVSAMASAKHGYMHISKALEELPTPVLTKNAPPIKDSMISSIKTMEQVASKIYKIVIHSPYGAKNFRAGHVFKLQNFAQNHFSASEPVPLYGAFTQPETGEITFFIKDCGASSTILTKIQPGESVCLMGPTGKAAKIPHNQNILLLGEGVGNVAHVAFASAARSRNCHITWHAHFNTPQDIFLEKEMARYASISKISVGKNPWMEILRNDPFEYDAVFVSASLSLLTNLQHVFKGQNIPIIAAISAPMQCMMKGVCGQCIRTRRDGTMIFTCAEPQENLCSINTQNLKNRLAQNRFSG